MRAWEFINRGSVIEALDDAVQSRKQATKRAVAGLAAAANKPAPGSKVLIAPAPMSTAPAANQQPMSHPQRQQPKWPSRLPAEFSGVCVDDDLRAELGLGPSDEEDTNSIGCQHLESPAHPLRPARP